MRVRRPSFKPIGHEFCLGVLVALTRQQTFHHVPVLPPHPHTTLASVHGQPSRTESKCPNAPPTPLLLVPAPPNTSLLLPCARLHQHRGRGLSDRVLALAKCAYDHFTARVTCDTYSCNTAWTNPPTRGGPSHLNPSLCVAVGRRRTSRNESNMSENSMILGSNCSVHSTRSCGANAPVRVVSMQRKCIRCQSAHLDGQEQAAHVPHITSVIILVTILAW